jgi:hypothetical protein
MTLTEINPSPDLPKPPKAMTLAERRKQVKESRDELSPMRGFMDAPGKKPKGKPHSRPKGDGAKHGPAAEEGATPRALAAAAATDPAWVSSWAEAYPGSLSIGGHLQFGSGTAASYSGLWMYLIDEDGKFVLQQQVRKATDDPRGDTPDSGAWCYGWWPANSLPADQCFWWVGSELGGTLEDGKKYYAWIFMDGTDGSSSPNGTTSPWVEAFFNEFSQDLYSGLHAAGYSDSTAVFQGSSVTGQSFKTGEPFRAESDYDIALAGASLMEQAKKAGVGLRSGGTRTGPLREIDLRKMRLSGLAEALSRKGGREVHFMIYASLDSATGRAPSMIVPKK